MSGTDCLARLRQALQRACVALPLFMLAANVLAWLRWGTDLPFLDDWRAYNTEQTTSLAPARLFEAANNTIAPVGLALDALAQRWLGGNPLPYQTLSMLGVLGGLLWLQWRLLGWALRQPVWQALAFAFTVFMLQSGSYWGEQNLAYHQALPLLALLGAAWLNFGRTRPDAAAGGWRLAGVLALGLLAGLSYVSGAVGALVMGGGWWLLAWRMPPQALRAHGMSGGAALALAGLLTTALQMGLTRRSGADSLGQSMRLTWPHEGDFWWFMAGKLGRTSGHGFESLALEAAWVALLALALLAAAAFALRGVWAAGGARRRRLALVWLPLLAVVLAYLALVSLGRAGLRGADEQGAAALFRLAYGRFHFFWATLLPPWLAATLAVALRRRAERALAALLLAALALAAARGVFDVAAYYRSASAFRAGEIRCLARQLGSGQPVLCQGFDAVGITDFTRAYLHARRVGASFVRYLPIAGRDGFGHEMLRLEPGQMRWQQARQLEDGWLQGLGDAQLLLAMPADRAAACRVLGVQALLRAGQSGVAQLFYRLRGQAGFEEGRSVRKPYAASRERAALIEFVIESPEGLEPELRLDPLEGQGEFRVDELRVACLLPERAP